MTVTVQTDREADRILSLRLASKVPLPPEICLNDIEGTDRLFRSRMFYVFMGLIDHPVIRMLESIQIDASMARTLSKATYLDRMSHYASWMKEEHVKVIDLNGDPEPIVPSEDGDADRESEGITVVTRRNDPGDGPVPDTEDMWEPDGLREDERMSDTSDGTEGS